MALAFRLLLAPGAGLVAGPHGLPEPAPGSAPDLAAALMADPEPLVVALARFILAEDDRWTALLTQAAVAQLARAGLVARDAAGRLHRVDPDGGAPEAR